MPHYRVYVLDEHGHLTGGFDLDCTEDDVAREHARTLADGHEAELWRLVAQFKFEDARHRPKRRRKAVAPSNGVRH
jgi:hypothetical protein